MTQISANISPETRERLERYVRARGLKKGFVIEQALLHHLQALGEIPEEAVIPPRIVITSASGERLLERLESQEAPNRAIRELFGEDGGGTPCQDSSSPKIRCKGPVVEM